MAQLGSYCFKNATEVPVNGLHVIFDGTQGTLHRARLTAGPTGRIKATDNQLNVFLDAPLAPWSPTLLYRLEQISTDHHHIYGLMVG